MKHTIINKLFFLFVFLICFKINIYAAETNTNQPKYNDKGVVICENTQVVNNETIKEIIEETNKDVTMPTEDASSGETNIQKNENVTSKVQDKTEKEINEQQGINNQGNQGNQPNDETSPTVLLSKLGVHTLSTQEKQNGSYDCMDEVNIMEEDENGVKRKVGTKWVEQSYGKCYQQAVQKIEDSLNAWGTRVSAATVAYLDMEFYAYAPSGYSMFVNKNNNKDAVAFYLWDGTTNSPTFYQYVLTMKNIYLLNVVSNGYGYAPHYDTFNGYVAGSRIYDFYILNVDNPSARYYRANNGKYFRLIEGTDEGAVGPQYKNQITFSSEVDKDRGTNYVIRVRFQDDKWLRQFSGFSAWGCVWYNESGTSAITSNKVKDMYGLRDDNTAYHQEYYKMNEAVTIRYKRNLNNYERTQSLFPFKNAAFPVVGAPDMQFGFFDKNAWKDVEVLAAASEQLEVYGGYKRGHITINKDSGIWTWEQHRQATQIVQKYLVQPVITTKKSSNSYTVCMGQYKCDCADIQIICSCEDEEGGCDDKTTPTGTTTTSTSTSTLPDDFGPTESLTRYDETGKPIPTGGTGWDIDEYLTGSATLVE